VTNRDVTRDIAHPLAEAYRRPRGIETSYRGVTGFLPKTSSPTFSVRLFYRGNKASASGLDPEAVHRLNEYQAEHGETPAMTTLRSELPDLKEWWDELNDQRVCVLWRLDGQAALGP
jgi:hypothetical protein